MTTPPSLRAPPWPTRPAPRPTQPAPNPQAYAPRPGLRAPPRPTRSTPADGPPWPTPPLPWPTRPILTPPRTTINNQNLFFSNETKIKKLIIKQLDEVHFFLLGFNFWPLLCLGRLLEVGVMNHQNFWERTKKILERLGLIVSYRQNSWELSSLNLNVVASSLFDVN